NTRPLLSLAYRTVIVTPLLCRPTDDKITVTFPATPAGTCKFTWYRPIVPAGRPAKRTLAFPGCPPTLAVTLFCSTPTVASATAPVTEPGVVSPSPDAFTT